MREQRIPEDPESIAIVLPGGFITGGALQLGVLKKLYEAGLLARVKVIAAVSVGIMNGFMIAAGIFEEAEAFWRQLHAQHVFRRRSMRQLGISHLAIVVAALLEQWQRHKPQRIFFIQRPCFSRRLILLSLLLGFAITFGAPASLPSFPLIVLGTLAAFQLLRQFVGMGMRCCVLIIQRGSVRLFLRRLQRFLENPNLHIDGFNEYEIEKTIREYFDLPVILQKVLEGPIRLIFPVSNFTTQETEVYSVGAGTCHRIDVEPWEPVSPEWIAEMAFASTTVPVMFSLRLVGDKLYFDGAKNKPHPLSYTFDADVDLIISISPRPKPNFRRPIGIGDVIPRLFEMDQNERFAREEKIADEKDFDVEVLQGIPDKFGHAIDRFVEDAEVRERLKTAVQNVIASSKFSFRHDRVIPRITISPEWEPSIEVSPYGRYGDFALIPDLIDRGCKEASRQLKLKLRLFA